MYMNLYIGETSSKNLMGVGMIKQQLLESSLLVCKTVLLSATTDSAEKHTPPTTAGVYDAYFSFNLHEHRYKFFEDKRVPLYMSRSWKGGAWLKPD